MSALPPPVVARASVVAWVALLVVASACSRATTGEGTPRLEVAAARSDRLETADWAPFRGSVRVGRTWNHSGGHPFPAVDFEVPAGTSIRVYAAGPGTVFASSGECPDTTAAGAHAGCNGGNGNFVDILHPDGHRSRYLHLREGSVVVRPGQYVCRGCLIGRSGWSGNVLPHGPDGAHLHYEELLGYSLVPPGPMFARTTAGRVLYPAGGRTWHQVGIERPLLVNDGFPRPDPAPSGSCFGFVPTMTGTTGRDQLRGTPGHDVILARGGNDRIVGADGEDRICAGAGDDLLVGELHPDLIDGGGGSDTCYQGDLTGLANSGPGRLVACESPSYTLTVVTGGTVVTSHPLGIECPRDCVETFVTHASVTLTADPPRADGWAGCDLSSPSTCTVEMNRDRTVRA